MTSGRSATQRLPLHTGRIGDGITWAHAMPSHDSLAQRTARHFWESSDARALVTAKGCVGQHEPQHPAKVDETQSASLAQKSGLAGACRSRASQRPATHTATFGPSSCFGHGELHSATAQSTMAHRRCCCSRSDRSHAELRGQQLPEQHPSNVVSTQSVSNVQPTFTRLEGTSAHANDDSNTPTSTTLIARLLRLSARGRTASGRSAAAAPRRARARPALQHPARATAGPRPGPA